MPAYLIIHAIPQDRLYNYQKNLVGTSQSGVSGNVDPLVEDCEAGRFEGKGMRRNLTTLIDFHE